MTSSILAIAEQAGGARAITPVIRALLAHGREVRAVASAVAGPAWTQDGVAWTAPERFGRGAPVDVACAILSRLAPAVVLAGTSVGETLERVLVREARSRDIPTVAVLDSWVNYAPRFEGPAGPLEFLPDRLAVMDEDSRARVVALGASPTTVVVTGQPYLDSTPEWSASDRAAARAGVGVAPGERLLVFASEPLRAQSRGSTFTELDALQLVGEALAECPGWGLLIKPHPTEDPAMLRAAVAAARLPARVAPEVAPRRLMLAADAVVGVSSIFLLEAALFGAAALSAVAPADSVPSDTDAEPYFGTRLGVVTPVGSVGALARFLRAVDIEEPARRSRAAAARARLGLSGRAPALVARLVEAALDRGLNRTM